MLISMILEGMGAYDPGTSTIYIYVQYTCDLHVLLLTALSNHHELKCLCYWQLLLRTLAKISDKFSLKVVKEGIHFEILKQLIDPPKSSENQEVGTNL